MNEKKAKVLRRWVSVTAKDDSYTSDYNQKFFDEQGNVVGFTPGTQRSKGRRKLYQKLKGEMQ